VCVCVCVYIYQTRLCTENSKGPCSGNRIVVVMKQLLEVAQ